jgi:ABC-type uncharacterized transport system involved in gliding motility auxiliary subunit
MTDERVIVGFLTGHGERNPGGRDKDGLFAAVRALGEASYAPTRVELLTSGSVPESVDVLIVASPRSEPLPQEIEVLDAFMKRGGRLLALLDPGSASLADFLQSWGALVGEDVVIDPRASGRLVGLDESAPVVSRYESSPVTLGFSMVTFFPLTRSVRLPETLPKEARGWTILRSGDGSWAETGPMSGPLRLDPGQDRLGPISMAVAVQHPKSGGTRLVVFGDSDFASNKYWRVPGAGDLFLNSVAWLAERGDEIAIRAPEILDRRVELTARQARGVFVSGVVLLPLAIVGAGAWVAYRRYGR